MIARLIAGLFVLAVALAGCQGERITAVQRVECGLADAVICDAIVQQVRKRAASLAEPPLIVVAPYPDELFQRGGDFSVFVAFATLDPTEPVSTWTATKVQSVSGALDTDWSVAKWNDALPPHLVAALRKAQGEPPASG